MESEDLPGFMPASQMMGRSGTESADDPQVAEVCDDASNPGDGPVVKRRRVHLDACQIQQHASSEEGARALSDPLNVRKSSRDPNRGMYPRLPDQPPGTGFRPASRFKAEEDAALPATGSYAGASWQRFPPSTSQSRASKKLPPQSNNLKNYFSASPEKCKSPAGSPLKIKTEIKTELSASQGAINPAGLGGLGTGVKSEIKTEPNETAPKLSKSGGTLRGKRPKPGRTPTFNRDNAFLYDTTLAKPAPSKPKVPDNKFGLFGADDDVVWSSDDDDDLCYFNSLPTELVENILCRLPLMDLLLNVSHVCHRWNDIIGGANFVPWKKKYLRLKLQDQDTKNLLDKELRNNNCLKREFYLPGLVRLVKSVKNLTTSSMDLNHGLSKHHMFEFAVDVIKERLPDCVENDVPHPYSVVAMLVVLSESVQDISKIIKCLIKSNSVTAMEIVECLYCIATYLLRFKFLKAAEVWNGMHYRLFYALYLYENEYTTTAKELQSSYAAQSGQQSIMRYSHGTTNVQMTHEQVRICKHEVQQDDVLKIVAFAGTGKTTTLVKYTQMRPNKKFLLLVYNKSVCEHAKTKFPSNVAIKTGHALAYAKTGFRYKKAMKLGNVKLNLIIDHFKARKGEALYVQAQHILDTINAFQASPDFEIGIHHVPRFKLDKNGARREMDDEFKRWYVEQASIIWAKMYDFNNRSVPISHDGYLKAYQLSRPRIYGYDVLLIDEAQDMTPALSWVLFQQTQPKILVGDPHQQIYSFRGATNAMQQVEATQTFYLTQSFRFGPEISFVASNCLEFLKNEKKKTLVGNGNQGAVDGSVVGQLAIITRSNFTLFSEAVKKLCYSDMECRPAFVGGVDGFGFEMIMDIYLLLLPPEERMSKVGREIKNPLVQRFPSLDKLEEFASKTGDSELLGKIKIVKTYNNQLPNLLATIQRKCIKDIDCADLVFSTAHKAKGLEFPTVRLTDDYNVGMGNVIGNAQQSGDDENNILYVAVTRAKKRLILNQTLYLTLGITGEKFLQPKHSKELQKQNAVFTCYKTHSAFEPVAGTLTRKRLIMENGEQKGGGLVSPQTVKTEFPAWTHLLGTIRGEQDEESEDDDDYDDDDFDDAIPNLQGFKLLRGMDIPIGPFVFRL